MIGKWESGTKMDVSKKILMQTMDSLQKLDNLEVALRMYGHQSPLQPQRDCKDTKLEVPFGKNNFGLIKSKIKLAQPKGTTPIAYSLEQSGPDFPDCPECRNIIILITDGEEECEGDPCAVSASLQSKGIVLKPFVIGIGLDANFAKTFECVGKYFDATNEKSFQYAMGIIISQALNSTTAQVNLLDINNKPTETNVNMTFYDMHTGLMKYNYVHTINNKGNPDTIPLDPLPTYKITVHTIPPVEKDSIELVPGKHTIIAIDAPQGYLNLKTAGMSAYKSLQFIVRKKGEMNTLNLQDAEKTEKYLVGKYDLEVLTLPRLIIEDVEVGQSKTTSVQIPQPGLANILTNGSGYGSLYLEEKNKLTLIYTVPENSTRENLVLLPGKYRFVYRPKSARESIYTIEREFKIESGSSSSVKAF
jgi:Ca-activated chloride channel family protein